MLSTKAEPRRQLSPRLAYAHVAAVIGLALFASSTPSPLYGTYRALWGFSPVVLTLVYATYAIGVLAALLVAGRVSDEAGRRVALRRPPPRRGGPPARAARRAGRPDGRFGAVHVGRLGRLAVRGPGGPGPGHRTGAGRRQRRAARPASAPGPGGRRPDERRGERRRARPRRARVGDPRAGRAGAARDAVRRAAGAVRRGVRRRARDARARGRPPAPPADAAAPEHPGRRPAAVLPGRPGRGVVVVDRGTVPVTRADAGRDAVPHRQPHRGRAQRVRARRLRRRRAACVRPHTGLAGRLRRLVRAGARDDPHRLLGLGRLAGAVLDRLRGGGRRLR